MACSSCSKGKKINRTSSRINQKSKVTIPKRSCTTVTKRTNEINGKRKVKTTLRRR